MKGRSKGNRLEDLQVDMQVVTISGRGPGGDRKEEQAVALVHKEWLAPLPQTIPTLRRRTK